MTHCLVTFLGRATREQGTGPYRQADYRFPDGHRERAAFLGFPLRAWLEAEKLVIFGTAESMWDHLFEGDLAEGDLAIEGKDDERVALIDDVQAGYVTQARLDSLAPHLAAHLCCEVQLTIIPRALEAHEQTRLLEMLAAAAKGADLLSLDITHAFRHLPMLAFTAALCLRFVQPGLSIEGLWYGALDPETDTASVHNLGGLLETADWLAALQRHEWLGDYEGIADLVEVSDAELAKDLRTATFRESIHQAQQARGNIRNARNLLNTQSLQGPGALFQPVLLERMNWVDEQALYLRQRRNALDALERKDYLRASLYGFEGFITKLTQDRHDSGRINDYQARAESREAFESEKPRALWCRYELLRDLRNVLAHGNRPAFSNTQQAIASPEALGAALEKCFSHLLPKPGE